MASSVIGWYGPLVDLSRASSHIGGFVQLLVFVHRCTPVQYKLSKGGEVIRTDIQVGDDTMPFCCVSLWQKQMGALAVAGDIILLQNVKIVKIGHAFEARTAECSSLRCLVHPYDSLLSKGVDELIQGFRGGEVTVQKLRKVIKWVQRAGFALRNMRCHIVEKKRFTRNWKAPVQQESQNFLLLSEVLNLRNSCQAVFNASIGEIFLPITWRALGDFEKEKMFMSRRVTNAEDNSVAKDFICSGCQLCGSPLDYEGNGCLLRQNSVSLYCPKSTNHFHVVGLIYRPFMLYVWDESDYLPLLVRNKAAELLFGNIRAERVYSSYERKTDCENPNGKDVLQASGKVGVDSCSLNAAKDRNHGDEDIDHHLIWLIILKLLFQHGNNSPLRFEVTIEAGLDIENGKFEMVSVSIPCMRTK